MLCYDFGYGEIYPNIYAVWNPYNSKLYKLDESIERDIDVSHNGAVVTPERIRYVELFKRANFPITYTGSQQKHIFPYQALLEEDYVKIYQRSKISLCFNDSIFGQTAVARKQKIIEAGLCGGFPLVTNPETYTTFKGSWFKEGIHFISMNENNCIDKIKYYLNHPDKRKEISENLHKEINAMAKSDWQVYRIGKDDFSTKKIPTRSILKKTKSSKTSSDVKPAGAKAKLYT